jgi:peroxiredoxin
MKHRPLIAALICCTLIVSVASAQKRPKGGSAMPKEAPKEATPKATGPKSPADQARDEFNKVRNEQGGKFDQARFDKVIKPGVAFLEQYPTNGNAPAVVRDLVGWIDTVKMDRKTDGASRTAFLSQLKYVLLNERYKEGLSEDAKAALGALDVAAADAELRENPSRPALAELREKINAFAEMPKSSRFLPDREISYYQIVNVLEGPQRGEAHLTKLTQHADKGVADTARRELNLVELRRDPVVWKLKGIDGKEFDFAQNRGKIIAIYFWSTANRDIAKNLDTIHQVQSDYRKKGVELVTVSYDKAEDREKLDKFLKENRFTFPVHFDGTGNKNEFGAKLNYTSAPKLAVFDQKGVLAYYDLQPNQFEPAVKKLLEPPPKKKA